MLKAIKHMFVRETLESVLRNIMLEAARREVEAETMEHHYRKEKEKAFEQAHAAMMRLEALKDARARAATQA